MDLTFLILFQIYVWKELKTKAEQTKVCPNFEGFYVTFFNRSAPEFGSLPRDSALRKTQSHPTSGAKATSPLALDSKKGRKELSKHERCKSMPLQEVGREKGADSATGAKSSCPNSPVETWKDLGAQLKTNSGDAAESPKPKKTNFRGLRSLQRKSKNEGGSGGGGGGGGNRAETSPSPSSSSTSYANTHVVPEGGRQGAGEGDATLSPLSQAGDCQRVSAGANSLTS